MPIAAILTGALICDPRQPWPGILDNLYEGWRRFVDRLLLFVRGQEAGSTGVPTKDLIRRFQRGQSRAFELLFDRYKDYVYRVALYVTRNGHEAEEAVQETFIDVLRALPHYNIDGPARFETWLYRVTVNRCRSRMRRRRLPTQEWDDLEERLERLPSSRVNGDPEKTMLQRERAVALWRAVDELSEGHRVAVLLRYQQGLSYEEIAEVLEVNIGTVKSRLYYAHKKLKDRLQAVLGNKLDTD
jgi:RNA polymerase sigma-70 factor (ECF subfamily)